MPFLMYYNDQTILRKQINNPIIQEIKYPRETIDLIDNLRV